MEGKGSPLVLGSLLHLRPSPVRSHHFVCTFLSPATLIGRERSEESRQGGSRAKHREHHRGTGASANDIEQANIWVLVASSSLTLESSITRSALDVWGNDRCGRPGGHILCTGVPGYSVSTLSGREGGGHRHLRQVDNFSLFSSNRWYCCHGLEGGIDEWGVCALSGAKRLSVATSPTERPPRCISPGALYHPPVVPLFTRVS